MTTPLLLEAQDAYLIKEQRKAGILRPAKKKGGVILVTCGDGHRFRDIFLHQLTLTRFIHPIVLNGGPLLFAHDERDVLLRNIADAVKFKEFTDVILLAHWPCAIAHRENMTLAQVEEKTVEASVMVKGFLGEKYAVFPELHVDFKRGSAMQSTFIITSRRIIHRVDHHEKKRTYAINARHRSFAHLTVE